MNPIRYWMKIVVSANRRKAVKTRGELMGAAIGNVTMLIVVATVSVATNLLAKLAPTLAPLTHLVGLLIMIAMIVVSFAQSRKHKEWRNRQKPAE